MTGEVLYIIPLITRLLPKTKQFIYNVFVTSIHSVDQQRNSPPKTLTSLLSNRQRLGWYISRLLHWQVTGLRAEWYQRQKVLLFTLTAVIIHPLPMNYPKIIDRRKLWSAHASERNVEKTRVISIYISGHCIFGHLLTSSTHSLLVHGSGSRTPFVKVNLLK